ncbi:P-loop containing nucleoside triphosphate hydrolase protein [Cokeromyces recurvatus]|uniref:P-loop containing nucleoside triphosphate hydrolase protein n=1 Tax=Cokeromyces recurvatus TaxID=90255 RepID=UPI00221F7ADE|nr:P-loop containing nucleoside triphosphate hydrolase protein [Cokeromyces recurvatus]KAI7901054.1 P-loop containing nucleoside triphosphate hydrolase protein [Cokeromyces recurvatus]
MAKKKSKITSNRGYATVSVASKKIEAPPASKVKEDKPEKEQQSPADYQTEILSVPQNDIQQDPILKLVKKYRSLNEHKAQTNFERLTTVEPQLRQIPDNRFRSFNLSADLEKELLHVIQDVSFVKHKLNGWTREKAIGQLDLIYRTLVRLGFQNQDIKASFTATLSCSIEEHLDWLCINVPYDRMPIGFFDKYFNDNMDVEETQVDPYSDRGNTDTNLHDTIPIIDKLPTKPSKQKEEVNIDDIKSRILQAAYDAMDEEETKDVNEQHAELKIKIMELEKLLPSENKKKKKVKDETTVVSGEELQKTLKKIRALKDKLASLEVDWDFDKQKAKDCHNRLLQQITEEKRQQELRVRKERLKEKEQKEKEQKEKSKEEHDMDLNVDINDMDDEDGLFGGLMMDEEEENAILATSTTTTIPTHWNIIEFNIPESYKGKLPKDLLLEYCNKRKWGKQSYNSTNIAYGIWRSTLKIENNSELSSFELPDTMATSNRQDAVQLIALYGLFTLDYTSSVYKVLHTSYKELWDSWKKEKIAKEESLFIESEKERFSFLAELVDESLSKVNTKDNAHSKDNVDIDDNEKTIIEPEGKKIKRQQVFSKMQSIFKRRLNTKEYLSMKDKRKDLPIAAYRDEILQLLKNNQVLIISGETGCGKSTQVPQFLAEDLLINSKESGSVVCTQPRRISAMSIANRVSSEMADRPKSTGTHDAMVGYQIRLESKMSEENVLLFCTTGILLRRLESDKYLHGVTHVVVDEVHERTIESDFLLIILKKLCQVRTDIKIILMSATVEANRFSQYFGNCPVISVPGRTYPVHVQYLEDVIENTGYVLEEDSPFAVKRSRIRTAQGNVHVSGHNGSTKRVYYEMFQEDSDDEDPYDFTRIESKLTVSSVLNQQDDDDNNDNDTNQKYSRQTRKTIKRMDEKKINYDLILDLLDYVCIRKKKEPTEDDKTKLIIPETGAILIFLPGMNEIRKIYELASSHHVFGDPNKFLLIALHSTLSSENQEKAFDIPPEGIRKIVFSTNIAETGVTISDVTVVIDTGMAKVVSYDDKKRVSRLLQKYIAKANARQRRGRAGRVQEGVCFHLFTQQKYNEMADYETPEILRLPLEELCLRIKVCHLGNIRDVLSAALDAPTEEMINNAISTLQEVQALSTDGQEILTPLGAHLSNLPVDVHIGKMILFGAIFRCLDPILTIAAALSFKSPFTRPFGKEDEADAARNRFRVENSDFLTIYKAYQTWRDQLSELRKDTTLSTSSIMRRIRQFCKNNFLSEQNLEMIEDMKRQYLGLLMSIGFVKISREDTNPYNTRQLGVQLCRVPEAYNSHSGSIAVVNAALTAGLYPKIAEYLKESKQIITKNMDLHIHPSSILFHQEHTFTTDFLVYNTVVMNNTSGQIKNRIYMWEASLIDAVAVILFSTHLDIKVSSLFCI